jgi:hypothetical protein
VRRLAQQLGRLAADAAIVKAGDTREVRLTLSKLINHR